jgi:hypothetical protein
LDHIYDKLDQQEKVIGIFFDLQKAFDTVNHAILLHKMFNYGIRGIAYGWFESYLCNRRQFTAIANVRSNLAQITCGVPQGSVLGPLLFLLYVNDVANVVPGQDVKLFADDTNLFISSKSIDLLSMSANNALTKLHLWFLANRLSLNVDKTCYMVFLPHKESTEEYINLQISGTMIKKVRSCRYLGLIIDDQLKWTAHIDHVYCQLLKLVGIFYKLRSKLSTYVLRLLYFAFVHSHILYGIEIYANTKATHLDKLIKLNNRILRILQHRQRLFPVRDLYVAFNTLAIPDLHDFQLLNLVHKAMHHRNLLPTVFSDYFVSNVSLYYHDTRAKTNIHIHRANTTFGQRSIKYKGSLLWNNLPIDLKTIESVRQFKRKVQHLFLMNN